ncbi:SelT/SelW/SelH family protein [Labrenzia suaedae]|uniref:SelT/SelW/SelH family protein n=1 Tax=Roseibium litorale TaxID=2803841 RepID=A0ABR9CJ76_9HYPH|nr:SelT/SelW/SelH family protein [Roseibium litorale]MBD8890694.1 SelT/SelW/SelH family protein [Roseibium litorale]
MTGTPDQPAAPSSGPSVSPESLQVPEAVKAPDITITYCRQCGWLLRTAWMAQEILTTFSEDVAAVTLVPGTGGIFTITCDGHLVWDRKTDGGFPDAKTLKTRLRNLVWPDKDLGHSDAGKTG